MKVIVSIKDKECSICKKLFDSNNFSQKYCSDECRKIVKKETDRKYRLTYAEKRKTRKS